MEYKIEICDSCYYLMGEMCHTPGCVFIREKMSEVSKHLNMLMIRPIVDGVQIDDLYIVKKPK